MKCSCASASSTPIVSSVSISYLYACPVMHHSNCQITYSSCHIKICTRHMIEANSDRECVGPSVSQAQVRGGDVCYRIVYEASLPPPLCATSYIFLASKQLQVLMIGDRSRLPVAIAHSNLGSFLAHHIY